ncbi:MAG: hypothetical protein DRP74_02600 [Candidatus Omnitrophota bacterium]|nr:MAG: hypothetical protein DRP74_02600 [Candidatus Omnitrophota bacterium]
MSENEGEFFNFTPSCTYKIRVGCGNFYITICYDEKRRFKRVFIPRNSKFHCDLIVRDGLARQATFQGKRSLRQLVRDLRGNKAHHCDKYNVTSQAASCQDAVAQAILKWLKVKRRRKKDNLKD